MPLLQACMTRLVKLWKLAHMNARKVIYFIISCYTVIIRITMVCTILYSPLIKRKTSASRSFGKWNFRMHFDCRWYMFRHGTFPSNKLWILAFWRILNENPLKYQWHYVTLHWCIRVKWWNDKNDNKHR